MNKYSRSYGSTLRPRTLDGIFGIRQKPPRWVSSEASPDLRLRCPRVSIARSILGSLFKLTAAALFGVLVSLPFLNAFEAHIITVSAEIRNIDPPVLTLPGDVGWDNPIGGRGLVGSQDIVMSDPDSDATHIFYTFGAGTDPLTLPEPRCGEATGGAKDTAPHLVISSDTVIKAIACDGDSRSAHHSVVNTKIYTFARACNNRFLPLDLVIIFDRSGSMRDDGKFAAAKSASGNFLDNLNSNRDQAGLVSFADTAVIDKLLTADIAGVKASIESLVAGGATNIGEAIGLANSELLSGRPRSSSTKVEILLTDGRASRPGLGDDNPTAVAFAQQKAQEAAARGFLLYTIGLGPDVNASFLTDLATRTGGRYYSSPTPQQLQKIYRAIAQLLCGSGSVSGFKFKDLNQDGLWQKPQEPPLGGWTITLKRGAGIIGTATTDPSGFYQFTDLPTSTPFTLIEETRSGWLPTAPGAGKIDFTLTTRGQSLTNQNFGNSEPGQACTPVPVQFPNRLALLAAGRSNPSDDDILLSGNTTINGDVRSNDEVLTDGSGGSRTINGNATAGHTVDVARLLVTGSTFQHASTTALPDIPVPEFINRARDGGQVNGSLIFPNNTGGIILGPTEIFGDLIFGENNSVTIRGPLYIQGDLVIGPRTTISQDPAFGNTFTIIVVDGVVDIDSKVTFKGAGTTGAFLLVSNTGPKRGDNASIKTSVSDSDLGAVVLYAQNGNIHINAGRRLLAAFAYKGLSTNNPAIRLDNNVTVTWRPLPGVIACGPRFTPLKQVLINEFVPNPMGSNVGEPGLPLDGEWVELYNGSDQVVSLSGWALYDNDDRHELVIGPSNILGGNTNILPGGYRVVFRNGNLNFNLDNDADTVRLFNAQISAGGVFVDSHAYNYGGTIPQNKSFTRTPDGTANWVDPEPTPGGPNTQFVSHTPRRISDSPFSPSPQILIPEILLPQPGERDYQAMQKAPAAPKVLAATSTPALIRPSPPTSAILSPASSTSQLLPAPTSTATTLARPTSTTSVTLPPPTIAGSESPPEASSQASPAPIVIPPSLPPSTSTTPHIPPEVMHLPDKDASAAGKDPETENVPKSEEPAPAVDAHATAPTTESPLPQAPAESPPAKKDEAILPEHSDTSEAVIPAPISAGGSDPHKEKTSPPDKSDIPDSAPTGDTPTSPASVDSIAPAPVPSSASASNLDSAIPTALNH